MIFYFTATGNSLYVARQLEEFPISIPQVINQDDLIFQDDAIGVICPLYAAEPPKMVLEFLEKAKFTTNYFYLIFTYGKTEGDAPEYIHKWASDRGLNIDYVNKILMVDNFLPAFDMNVEVGLEKNIDTQIKNIVSDVKKRNRFIPLANQRKRNFHVRAKINAKENPSYMNGEQITVTDSCIGCGICVKVCPLNRFYLEDKMAKRTSPKCEFCLSCANNCPQKAIITSASDKNPQARFRNENVTLSDIIKSNNQNGITVQ